MSEIFTKMSFLDLVVPTSINLDEIKIKYAKEIEAFNLLMTNSTADKRFIVAAFNIVLVQAKLRPAYLTSLKPYQILERMAETELFSQVGFHKKFFYNKQVWTPDQIDELLTADKFQGIATILGYIANKQDIKGDYSVSYNLIKYTSRISGCCRGQVCQKFQLYTEICKYIDEDRKAQYLEKWYQYRELGLALGVTIKVEFNWTPNRVNK